jgi:hypothetical protein
VRIICNANPAGGHDQEISSLKVLCVFCKHSIEVIDFGLQGSSWQPKEYDAFMGAFLVKDQLTEIAVSDNQNPLLFPCDCQGILIGKTMRIIAGDSNDVMFALLKVGNESKVSALVEEEFHRTTSERTPLGGFGETSLPVTISFA